MNSAVKARRHTANASLRDSRRATLLRLEGRASKTPALWRARGAITRTSVAVSVWVSRISAAVASTTISVSIWFGDGGGTVPIGSQRPMRRAPSCDVYAEDDELIDLDESENLIGDKIKINFSHVRLAEHELNLELKVI